MKSKPSRPVSVDAPDVEDLIHKAKASVADRVPRKNPRSRLITGRGKMPGPGKKRVTVDLSENVYEKLKGLSIREGRSLRWCVEEAITRWMAKRSR